MHDTDLHGREMTPEERKAYRAIEKRLFKHGEFWTEAEVRDALAWAADSMQAGIKGMSIQIEASLRRQDDREWVPDTAEEKVAAAKPIPCETVHSVFAEEIAEVIIAEHKKAIEETQPE